MTDNNLNEDTMNEDRDPENNPADDRAEPAQPAEPPAPAPQPQHPAQAQPQPQPQATAQQPPYQAPQPASTHLKAPWLALVLSAFPGVGNIYNGLYLRGAAFFGAIMLCIYLAATHEPVFGFAVAFLWIFNALDAYRQATLINQAYAGGEEPGYTPRPTSSTEERLFAGGFFILVGLAAFFDRYQWFDIDWLLELWPIALVAVGVYLVWGAVRGRSED